MKKNTPYIAAAALFLFTSAVFIKDIRGLSRAEDMLTVQRSDSAERGVTVYLEELPVQSNMVNINTASAEELISLPYIGETKANSIIEYREQYGSFVNIDELSEVSGISESLLKVASLSNAVTEK